MKRNIFCLFVLLLYGCAGGPGNIKPNHTLSPNDGVVVFSFTGSGKCGYALFIKIRRIDGQADYSIGMQDMFEERDWERKTDSCKADSSDFSGKLKAISLAEGEYEIYRISGISRRHAVESTDKMSIRFTATGNKVTYIGNIHFIINDESYDYIFSDKSDWDLTLFQQKYPLLSTDYITDIPLQ